MQKWNPPVDHPEWQAINDIVNALKKEFGAPPKEWIVLGSGLGAVVERMTGQVSVPTPQLGLPQSKVAGHAGHVVRGELGGSAVAVLSGRVHWYEGHSAATLVRYVRAAHLWGVKHLIVTCSAGGIAEGLNPGELVALSDHINMMNDNPLRGPLWGQTRFPDLSHAYSPRMWGILGDCAKQQGTQLHEGVYAAMNGPAYETPAEIRMLKTVGADLVGMSTVPEVLAANEVGLEVMAIAAISNRAAGLSSEVLTHEDVQIVAGKAATRLADIFEAGCSYL